MQPMQYYNNDQSDVNDTSVIVEWLSHCVYSRVHNQKVKLVPQPLYAIISLRYYKIA